MNDNEREMDLALAEAEQENRLLRARNERLERELAGQVALDKKADNARELGLDYEPAPVQDSTCNETLRVQGKAYPRTCKKCGLGPCVGKPKSVTTPPAAQKPWVGLSEDEINKLRHLVDWTAEWSYGRFAYELERLLREKNT
jgi:hypothetical protein